MACLKSRVRAGFWFRPSGSGPGLFLINLRSSFQSLLSALLASVFPNQSLKTIVLPKESLMEMWLSPICMKVPLQGGFPKPDNPREQVAVLTGVF